MSISISSVRKITVLFSVLLLAACGSANKDTQYPEDTQREQQYKYGSIASDDGGISLFSTGRKKTSPGSGGLGVNTYLWRATLDTINFMPLASADPFGGVVLTDWYTNPSQPDERVKLNILIKARDLRADGVSVATFRQTKNTNGDWVDAPASKETATHIEDAILTRARQLRVASGDKS